METSVLKISLSMESYNLRTLAESLNKLTADLEFCPCNDEIYEKLEKVELLSEQIRELIETMEVMKNMSVI